MNNKRIHSLLLYLGCVHEGKELVNSNLGTEDYNDLELESLLPYVEELLRLIKEELSDIK